MKSVLTYFAIWCRFFALVCKNIIWKDAPKTYQPEGILSPFLQISITIFTGVAQQKIHRVNHRLTTIRKSGFLLQTEISWALGGENNVKSVISLFKFWRNLRLRFLKF